MSVWAWVGIAVAGVVALVLTRYLTQRIRERRGIAGEEASSADNALGQGLINSLLDLFLP